MEEALAALEPAQPNAVKVFDKPSPACINLQAIPLASGDFWFSVATGIATVFYIIAQENDIKNCFLVKVTLKL
jgi:hypothetical protein